MCISVDVSYREIMYICRVLPPGGNLRTEQQNVPLTLERHSFPFVIFPSLVVG